MSVRSSYDKANTFGNSRKRRMLVYKLIYRKVTLIWPCVLLLSGENLTFKKEGQRESNFFKVKYKFLFDSKIRAKCFYYHSTAGALNAKNNFHMANIIPQKSKHDESNKEKEHVIDILHAQQYMGHAQAQIFPFRLFTSS